MSPHIKQRSCLSRSQEGAAHGTGLCLASVSGFMLQTHLLNCGLFGVISHCLLGRAWPQGHGQQVGAFGIPLQLQGKGAEGLAHRQECPWLVSRLHLPQSRDPGTPVFLGWASVLFGLLPIRKARFWGLFSL